MISNRTMNTLLLLLAALLPTPGLAHESQPGLLEIRQLTSERWEVAWRAPIYYGKPHPARLALPADWEGRYGYRPVLLETFVERDRFAGTCYRAANWTCVGKTQGRGKLGDHRLGQVPVKTVWVYPLSRDFREQLCR